MTADGDFCKRGLQERSRTGWKPLRVTKASKQNPAFSIFVMENPGNN